MKRTGYIFHEQYLRHDAGGHPENSGRLVAIEKKVRASSLYKDLVHLEPRRATEAEIAANHDRALIETIRQSASNGLQYVDRETFVCSGSYDAALLSAGAGLTAVDQVLDRHCDNVFAAVRPPGHHAEHDRAMGFCLFNNVAIAARYAIRERGLNRVFIFDWDVHHGNGTQHSFYNDPSVYYSSIHQYPCYPGTGSANETGSGDGLGTTLNFPLDADSGDYEYLDIVGNKLIPEIFKFKPDLIIISAGFDAHEADPLAEMAVSTDCYGTLTRLIADVAEEVCGGRLISMLEGGYDPVALSDSVLIHLENLSA